jgi:hypothetical protein
MNAKKINKKWLVVIGAVFGASLIASGVFASATITLNSGRAVNLGAGAVRVDACGTQATVSALQSFDSSSQSYKTTTISISGIPEDAAPTGCGGKILSLAFLANSQTYNATWSVPTASSVLGTFYYGGVTGPATMAQTALTPFDTAGANLNTIAVALQ